MSPQTTLSLTVLLFQESEWWVAQCLEYDIAAQGKTVSEVKNSFIKTFAGQIVLDVRNNCRPLEGIGRAPKYYWDLVDKAELRSTTKPIYLPDEVSSVRATAEFALAA
jgi:hypothetical protein